MKNYSSEGVAKNEPCVLINLEKWQEMQEKLKQHEAKCQEAKENL